MTTMSSHRHSCMPPLPPAEHSREDAAQSSSSVLSAATAAGIHGGGDAFKPWGNLVFVHSPVAAGGTAQQADDHLYVYMPDLITEYIRNRIRDGQEAIGWGNRSRNVDSTYARFATCRYCCVRVFSMCTLKSLLLCVVAEVYILWHR